MVARLRTRAAVHVCHIMAIFPQDCEGRTTWSPPCLSFPNPAARFPAFHLYSGLEQQTARKGDWEVAALGPTVASPTDWSQPFLPSYSPLISGSLGSQPTPGCEFRLRCE